MKDTEIHANFFHNARRDSPQSDQNSLPEELRRSWEWIMFVPMNPSESWDRWIHELGLAVGKNHHVRATGTSGFGEMALVDIAADPPFPALLVAPARSQLDDHAEKGVVVAIDSETPDFNDRVAKCYEIISSATEAMRIPLPEIRWKGVIGPDPRSLTLFSDTTITLPAPRTIGSWMVQPISQPIIDKVNLLSVHKLGAHMHVTSWPVIVEGVSRGYSAQSIIPGVSRELTMLACLFTLAFRTPWIIRELPSAQGNGEIEIPAGDEGLTESEKGSGRPTELPEWFDHALVETEQSPKFRNALLAYWEGLRLAEAHPSYALIAYMACIQGCGGILTKKRDDQLRSMLEKILSGEETTRILRWYGHRSETAHQGVLWGSETIPPSSGFVFEWFNPDDSAKPIMMFVEDAARRSLLWHVYRRSRDEPLTE